MVFDFYRTGNIGTGIQSKTLIATVSNKKNFFFLYYLKTLLSSNINVLWIVLVCLSLEIKKCIKGPLMWKRRKRTESLHYAKAVYMRSNRPQLQFFTSYKHIKVQWSHFTTRSVQDAGLHASPFSTLPPRKFNAKVTSLYRIPSSQ